MRSPLWIPVNAPIRDVPGMATARHVWITIGTAKNSRPVFLLPKAKKPMTGPGTTFRKITVISNSVNLHSLASKGKKMYNNSEHFIVMRR
jgi:hypothetical protein